MRTASLRKLTLGAVAAGLVLTGCGTTAEGGSASATATTARSPACASWSRTRPAAATTRPPARSPQAMEDEEHRQAASRCSTSRAPAAPSVCSGW